MELSEKSKIVRRKRLRRKLRIANLVRAGILLIPLKSAISPGSKLSLITSLIKNTKIKSVMTDDDKVANIIRRKYPHINIKTSKTGRLTKKNYIIARFTSSPLRPRIIRKRSKSEL